MSAEPVSTPAAPARPTGRFGDAGRRVAASIIAVLLALACGAILIALWGVNPVSAYGALLNGAFGNLNSIAETLLRAIPLTCTGLAVAFAFRAGTFNIGAEGQLMFGGAAAAAVGLALPHLPPLLLIPSMMGSAMIAGALWSLLPGVLKLRFGANELITTIMLNYVAIHFISFLLYGPMQESAGYLAQTDRLDRATTLPQLIERTRLHIGFLIVLGVVALSHFALWHTSWGYKLRVVGLNARVALNSGMAVTALTVSAFLVSGALAGLAGYMEVVGVQRRMIEGLSPGFGYTGIIVALLGGTSPLGVLAAAILFAALQVGATTMETAEGVPSTLATIIQGLVVLFVIGRGTIDLALRRRGSA
ncbi:simple sugar transport system permease protein [Devosia enhydra]|uniref:Simple sugar transport system permease protein n=1 Tax=Devosia enhydra TaxID=665118 RepID=A0A1K2HZC1_9HYPH|nr:ABC transporter permease [Devosia enhydra]SFZ85432.1 simple sugar transport system permease protein [Devosia enhydra]